jgi:hypothetical protein
VDRLLLPIAAMVVVVASYRAAAARCRRAPSRRAGYIVASLAALAVAASLVPWVLAKLDPPWSESPAGIFVYLGKAAVVGGRGLVALGTLAGALVP